MLGVSGLLGNPGDGAPAVEAHEDGGGGGGGGGGGEMGGVGSSSGGFSEEEKGRGEDGERNSGGNRWPRQETLALLKVRSDMDVVFRDSSLKGPLWEEVSRKLAELGYHRRAKKCKEKFENVYKYHKRTREGRATKSDGKTYRFFDQLEALENHPAPPLLYLPPPPKPQTPVAAMPGTNPPIVSHFTVPSTTNPINVSSQNNATPIIDPLTVLPTPTTTNPTNPSQVIGIRSFLPNISTNLMLNSTSSSTSSDQEHEGRHRGRKRKWEDFFERIMKEVMDKQEEMQKKFLEALERRERDRMVREEAWRVQEMARLNREHELLVHERSITAAKDAAVIAFLQKISEHQNPNLLSQIQVQMQESTTPPLPPPPQPPAPPPPPPQQQQHHPPLQLTKILDKPKTDNGGPCDNFIPASPSRWPKAEVEALIKLRTNLDLKYQDNGPKGPLWEEISAAMRKLGYNRSSKRCKEKWENINKYFKKVKESNKKRPEDSKTCPYYHQLDALYREKNKGTIDAPIFHQVGSVMKPENPVAVPIMARPEQQWPLPLPQEQQRLDGAMPDHESENADDDEEINHEDEDDVDDEDEEDDEGGGYEIVTNKPSSLATVE
ncbi:trihelix transcription factor DF1-like [Cornus florida]|uniref:trihelix transcription factor DF1-like n=1 Tax=Cornus florida TaxID=4283 RepID=UPI00289FA594|nr:trihelix transcription factor DF1-like [Cornus florida]